MTRKYISFELDLTYACNLHCKWCNRLCGTKFQPPKNITVEEFMRNLYIIEPHVSQSRISVCGGEPTLHPQIIEILDLLVKVIRPKMRFPIDIYSNGVGSVVNKVLNQIRSKYSTKTVYGMLDLELSKRPSSPIDFCIIISKASPSGFYSVGIHEPIYRAAQDLLPNIKDYSKNCRFLDYCGYGVNAHGIFICDIAPQIATIFKLTEGLDHFPSPEEEEGQKKLYCKYCFAPCSTLKNEIDITPSFREALERWELKS